MLRLRSLAFNRAELSHIGQQPSRQRAPRRPASDGRRTLTRRFHAVEGSTLHVTMTDRDLGDRDPASPR